MKKKKNSGKKVLVVILLILVLVLGGGVWFIQDSLSPISKQEEEITFVINSGDTVKAVTKRLEEAGIIKNDFIATYFAKFKNLEDIKVGQYTLDKSWNLQKILETLNNPTASTSLDVKITFPEGMWAKEMAKKIAANTNVTEEELLTLWNDDTFLREMIEIYPFLTEDILNDQTRVKLEGYLFPETYYFYVDTTARAVTMKFLDQTNKIYEKYKDAFESSEFTIHEIFTLASITQFESGNGADDKIISGVWMNRLEKGMLLQSSVTVCYALYDYDHWMDCEVNPNIDSPYNTYKYAGIPIGPIDNPGETAIASVLYPEKTNYLYFIADVYGDGTVYYAETYAEHQKNIEKYLRP